MRRASRKARWQDPRLSEDTTDPILKQVTLVNADGERCVTSQVEALDKAMDLFGGRRSSTATRAASSKGSVNGDDAGCGSPWAQTGHNDTPLIK